MDLLFQKNIASGYFFSTYDESASFHEEEIVEVKQVHGKEILTLSNRQDHQLKEADGILWPSSLKKKMALCIKTADCMPVAVIGKKGVTLLHLGHRSLNLKLHLQSEIEKLHPTLFYIGPSIHSCCFEVTSEFKKNFPQSSFFRSPYYGEKLFFSLQEELQKDLRVNFPQSIVLDSGICTCCDLRFHSYRRDKTEKRNFNYLLSI